MRNIYVMKADGSPVVRLSQSAVELGLRVWSPDDSQLLFNAASEAGTDIYVMNSDGSNVRNLTD